MRSRSELTWSQESDRCSGLPTVCNDLDNDVNAAYALGQKFPDRIILIRYEDLSIDPYESVDKLIHFLGRINPFFSEQKLHFFAP